MHISQRYYTLFFIFLLAMLNLSAQDLLVRQASTDKKLSTADSVTTHKRNNRNGHITVSDYTNVEPYSSWNTGNVYAYKGQTPPATFKIDLRNFVMPTPSRKITSRYGYRATFGRNHYGLDVKVYTGDTIVSAWEGKVRVVKFDPNGWGKYILIRHPNGLETLYAHLSKQLVVPNQEVKAGEVIGLGGNTGRSRGSHLHLECRLLGQAINPELLFDFPNQKMTSDFYTWHSGSRSSSRGAKLQKENEKAEEPEERTAAVEDTKEPSATKSASSSEVNYHKVKKGETLYSIAKEHNVSLDHLLSSNGLSRKAKLREGQLLIY